MSIHSSPPTQSHSTPSTVSNGIPTTQSHSVPTTQYYSVPTTYTHNIPPTQSHNTPFTLSNGIPTTQYYSVPTTHTHSSLPTQSHNTPSTLSNGIPTTQSHSIPTTQSNNNPTTPSHNIPPAQSYPPLSMFTNPLLQAPPYLPASSFSASGTSFAYPASVQNTVPPLPIGIHHTQPMHSPQNLLLYSPISTLQTSLINNPSIVSPPVSIPMSNAPLHSGTNAHGHNFIPHHHQFS